jgi:8-oxo-dGTP diphosphatase
MDGYLCPPGGHVEVGETPLIAATREIKEELGVTIDPNDLEFMCVAARNSSPNEYVAYEFVLRDKKYDYRNAEPEKCSELVWVDPKHLPLEVIKQFEQIIKKGLIAKQPYLELGY